MNGQRTVAYSPPEFNTKATGPVPLWRGIVMSILIDTALASIDAADADAAREALGQADSDIKQRQKLIKLADRSPRGWATVREYVTDNLS